jgi:uncharacterized protein YkwD
MSSSVVSASADLAVVPGFFQSERLTLLKKIQEAEVLGVGIKTYLSAFVELEGMVKKGASQESIRVRLDSLTKALDYQLSSQEQMKHLAAPFTERDPEPKAPVVLLPLEKARLYVLSLVNADRAKYHLAPLKLDSIASIAGQRHTDEMASVGYCAHWDISGRKPWQRYTEAGGTHMDGENLAAMWGTCKSRVGTFAASEIASMEMSFMAEKPPHDGHRVQILRPDHNKLGVGLSCVVNDRGETRVALAQEFIDEYGQYDKIPSKIIRGVPFEVTGVLFQGVTLHAVWLRREPEPEPMTKDELNKTYSCSMPEDSYTGDDPLPKLAPMKVWTVAKRQHFLVRLMPDSSWKPGLYYVMVLASSGKNKDVTIVSTRTAHLD